MNFSLDNAQSLTRQQLKNIMGGSDGPPPTPGCGTGISCVGKNEGDKCGTKTCLCEKNSSTDQTLYCSTQIAP